jgi:hypothetical protein
MQGKQVVKMGSGFVAAQDRVNWRALLPVTLGLSDDDRLGRNPQRINNEYCMWL